MVEEKKLEHFSIIYNWSHTSKKKIILFLRDQMTNALHAATVPDKTNNTFNATDSKAVK